MIIQDQFRYSNIERDAYDLIDSGLREVDALNELCARGYSKKQSISILNRIENYEYAKARFAELRRKLQ